MKKLRLELEALEVTRFETAAMDARAAGTVRGNEATQGCGGGTYTRDAACLSLTLIECCGAPTLFC